MQYPGSLCQRAGSDAHRNNSGTVGGNSAPTRHRTRQSARSRAPIEDINMGFQSVVFQRLSARAVELAFLGHAFERLARALDAVLIIIAVGRKQFHYTIGAVRSHMADGPRRKIDNLADLVLVLCQRCSPELNLVLRHLTILAVRETPEFPFTYLHYSSQFARPAEKSCGPRRPRIDKRFHQVIQTPRRFRGAFGASRRPRAPRRRNRSQSRRVAG